MGASPGGRRLDLPGTDSLAEGARILTICNACRYCEGFCAVFPALEQRAQVAVADLHYLANLCHNCAECFYACQYAPPHEFAVNVPKTLAEIQVRSYREYAWPSAFFGKSSAILAAALLSAAMLWFYLARGDAAAGQFYRVISHRAMVAVFGAVSAVVGGVILIGLLRWRRESGWGIASLSAMSHGFLDALKLTYLDGGGQGCTYPGERRSRARWWFHHLTFYGFLLCFASTTVAAVYHYALGLRAPYDYLSVPVVLGTIGGIGLLAGPAGLLWLKRDRDPATGAAQHDRLDIELIVLLWFTSATGLLLLALRETRAMRPLLAIHLGIVLALFLAMPYGKFVHGVYRSAALVRYALERSRAKGIRSPGH